MYKYNLKCRYLYYSQISINLKRETSNKPLSVIFKSGITGNDKNESVKNGLKLMLGAIVLIAE